jgi:hypothetical protein
VTESYKVNGIKIYKIEQKIPREREREIIARDEFFIFFLICIGWIILIKCHALYVALFVVVLSLFK